MVEPEPRPYGFRILAQEPAEEQVTGHGLWIPANGHEHIKRALVVNVGMLPEPRTGQELPELKPGDVIWFDMRQAPGKLQRRGPNGWIELWVVDVADIVAHAKED